MKFSEIPNWGYVDAGTKVTDASGNKYVVGEQNDKGFVPLQNLSGGKDQAFDAMEEINHSQYKAVSE